ncbi:Rne/Rng family ribonuclease [Nakamurella sp.]|uniref:Rne/Rng family ribonuclease n=1 Tax=Nakamurella sp. TaxID=1869182 RepID=UPI0037835690
MTLTLESALADLPAKPRVHELSKRVGTTSKEMIAVLNERGLTVSSASASVPRAVAIAVIEHYLGVPVPIEPDESPTESPTAGDSAVGAPAHQRPPVESTAVERPVADDPGTRKPAGDPLAPLFLPPSETVTVPSEVRPAEDRGRPDEEDGAEEAPAKRSRRRRGRPAGRRSEPEEATEATEATEAVEAATPEPEADEAEAPADQGPDPDQDESSDGGARRRRRRGRRGRGRTVDTDEQDEDDAGEDQTPAGPTDTEEPAESEDDAEDAATESAAGAEVDAEEDSGGGGGSRRRRRRRRRTSGDEGSTREDDPDNTVVHVRESRAAAPAVNNEVQGVRGSTRLEAKRQRRRDSRDSSRRRPQILTEAEFLARRESVERVMAVRQRGDLAQVALLEDGILVEHFVSQTGADSLIGSVLLGKVQNVLPSMEAAFVDIGRGRNAVIYAGEVNWDAAGLGGKARRIESALTSGDTILAQVSKDPVGHKGARLTTQISLPGRFLVYVPGGGATGISRKLPDTERKRLKAILDRIVPEDAGVIIRTAAEGVSEEELARDVERLKAQWEEISRKAEAKGSAPTLLYAEPGTLIKVVRDLFNSDITRLVVDGDEAWEPVAEYVNAVAPELADRLVRWDHEGSDVFANYRIDEQIAKALERKVHLPSGGSLVIDRTEAMTVVDVNTGKYTGSGGNLEETVTKNNLEAAEEIVRQLRLRDIGGIIVVDFIDMVLESNRELVLRRLTEALGRDRTRHQVAEVTSLGLVQMTRKRMGTGLVEAFSEPCPHCGGRGIMLHEGPVATLAEPAPAVERRGKGRRRGRDGGRTAEEIVIPRVDPAAGRRPDPRGPRPPSVPAHHETEAPPADGPDEQDLPDVAGAAAAQGRLIAAVADAADAAALMADEAGEPVDVVVEADVDGAPASIGVDGPGHGNDGHGHGEDGPDDELVVEAVPGEVLARPEGEPEPAVVHEPEPAAPTAPAVPAASVPTTAAEPAPPVRRRRAAGRAAGAPPAAAAVDIVVAQPSGDGDGDGSAATVPSGGYLVSDDGAATRPRRRAASRPAGPSAAPDGSDGVVAPVDTETVS